MAFIRVEIAPFANRHDKVGNMAHQNFLSWQRNYPHLAAFKVKLSHNKDHIDFTDKKAFEDWQATWKHYYRRIF
jgi:hypothetical protein